MEIACTLRILLQQNKLPAARSACPVDSLLEMAGRNKAALKTGAVEIYLRSKAYQAPR